MDLRQALAAKKDAVSARWVEMVHKGYPFATVGFLRTQANPFVNPVGHRTKEAADAIMPVLLATEKDVPALLPALDEALEEFMRVRSIQEISPEEAVGVIDGLKNVLRAELAPELEKYNLYKELLDIELRVDAIGLMAFGIYTRCREKIYAMRVEEVKRANSQVIRRAERIIARAAAAGTGAEAGTENEE